MTNDPLEARFGKPWPPVPGEHIQVVPDIDTAGPWTDLDPKTPHGRVERIAILRNGTAQGRASVAIVIRLDDGTAVLAETTWRLFNGAARALAASPAVAEEVTD